MLLFGNMPPPSYEVTLPPGREWLYEAVAWAAVAMALAAGGTWLARRRALRPAAGRALLWLAAGCLAVAYSAGWVWSHRDAGVVPPRLAASVAVWMHGVWGVGAAVVLVAGWRHVRGGPEPGAGRALALAVVTLAASWVAGATGFRLALVFFAPGYLTAEAVSEAARDDWIVYPIALLGVNVAAWWAVWAFVLWVLLWVRAGYRPPPEPRSGRAPDGENP